MKTMFCRTWPRYNHLPTVLCRCATLVQAFPPGTRTFSSAAIVGDRPVLVRDFIRSSLYDPEHGYFSRRWGSVGVLDRSIQFHRLQGRKAYMEHLDNIYRQNDISWFTPVELFKPWYAHGIAEAILRTANLSYPLKKMFGVTANGISMTFNDFVSYIHRVHGYEGKPQYRNEVALVMIGYGFVDITSLQIFIFEIGGGSGTCAKGIMDYIMLNAPERVYNMMTYISVEISSSLADTQRKTVGEVSSHALKHRVECRDATDQLGWGETEQQPCWVIMLEVLDNLPHDLIYAENQVSPWKEVWVEKQLDRHMLSELYKPLTDPLILRCLDLIKDKETASDDAIMKSFWSKVFPRPRRYWLPTGCLKLLEVLHKALPKMSLVVSDFSYLPDVRIAGDRAPLVSTKKEGKSTDYNSYLDAKGDADIFFPTDFWLLERIDHFCSGWPKIQKDKSSKQGRKRRMMTLDTSSFMEEFGIPSKTRTKDGYNPLLEDFKNIKFYLSVPTHNIK